MKLWPILLIILGGCAAPRPIQPTAYQKASYECEKDMSRSEAQGLIAVALYHDCMRAHGWSK